MPVRFPCPHCNQLLSVTRRKIGTKVLCPHCGGPNLVPDEQAAARLANVAVARPAGGRDLISELIVYDDVPELIGESPSSQSLSTPAPPTSPVAGADVAGSAPRSNPSSAGQPVGSDLLLISRRTLYFQGVLFVVVAASAFSAGFFIGRGPAPDDGKGPQGATENKDPVVLSGTIKFARSSGDMQPDDGAVIAALPEGVVPEDLIAAAGLRPQDPDEPEAENVKAVTKLGGDFARADPSGSFQLVVPRPGPYHLLIISHQSKRPRGRNLQPAHLQEMAAYFAAPADLIGLHQYHWSLQHLAGSPKPLTHQFKLDGK